MFHGYVLQFPAANPWGDLSLGLWLRVPPGHRLQQRQPRWHKWRFAHVVRFGISTSRSLPRGQGRNGRWRGVLGPVTWDDPGNLVEMAGGSGKLTVCELENGHRNSGFTHEYGSHLGILVLLNPIVDVC